MDTRIKQQGIHQEEITAEKGEYHLINSSKINKNIKNKESVINLICLQLNYYHFCQPKA